MTDRTRSCRQKRNLLIIMDWLLTLAPLIIFGILGFTKAEPREKACLGVMVMVAMFFGVINVLMKCNYRFFVWLLLLGVYICMDDMLPVIITLVICTFFDEMIIMPMKKHYSTKYLINKEIDSRG